MSTPQSRLASTKWRWRNSTWLLTPILSVGLLSSVAFLYVGLQTRNRGVLKAAALYSLFTVFMFVVIGTAPEDSSRAIDNIAAVIMLGVWIGSSVHAFSVNRDFLRWKAFRHSQPWYASPPPDPTVTGNAAADLGLVGDQGAYWGTPPTAAPGAPPHSTPPAPPHGSPPNPPSWQAPVAGAPSLGPGVARPPRVQPGPSPAATPMHAAPTYSSGLTDLNRASEQDLRHLAGVGPVLAKRIVEERAARRGFRSVDELSGVVPPHVFARLRSMLTVEQAPPEPGPSPRGRIVDI